MVMGDEVTSYDLSNLRGELMSEIDSLRRDLRWVEEDVKKQDREISALKQRVESLRQQTGSDY